MALLFLKMLFCSCGQTDDESDQQLQHDDETARLIPDAVVADMTLTSPSLNQTRLQERFGTIVRAKERKMVNVGSHIPFNLHRQPLLRDVRRIHQKITHHQRDHLTPSPSSSSAYFDNPVDEDCNDFPASRYINYQPDPCPPIPYPRFASSPPRGYGTTARTSRPSSSEGEHRTVLNVRLIGFADKDERSNLSTTLSGDLLKDTAPRLPSTVSSQTVLKFHDTGAIVSSWGD